MRVSSTGTSRAVKIERNKSSPESRLVKALDKAETIIQHNIGKNPPNFDYAFNLQYGKPYFTEDALLEEIRSTLDEETRRHIP